jgi:hypothetical protein
MRTTLLIAGTLAVGVAMVPAGTADHRDESDQQVENLYLVVGDAGPGLEVWEGTNGHNGLQTTAEDDEKIDEPDSSVLILPPEDEPEPPAP